MARDTNKYAYYTVGILKGSELHKRLLAEAEELGSRHVPLTIHLWLREHAKLAPIHPARGDLKIAQQEESTVDLSNASEALDHWED